MVSRRDVIKQTCAAVGLSSVPLSPTAATAGGLTRLPTDGSVPIPDQALDPLRLIIGFDLLQHFDFLIQNHCESFDDTPIVKEIQAMRRRLTARGMAMPLIRIRDNMHLDRDQYMIEVFGECIVLDRMLPSNDASDPNSTVDMSIVSRQARVIGWQIGEVVATHQQLLRNA